MSQLMKKRFPSITSIDVGTDGNTSFLRAARNGQLDKVLEHLKSNIDINTSNANGLNALHLASKDGHVEIVAELLKRGAVVDAATKKGNTALHIASLAGQEEVVKLLVSHGASVNVQSQNGFTPLYMAAQENHDNVVKYLLANGANQSLSTEDGFTPLAVAMQQGHDKVVTVLLENDTRGKVRLPALHIAAKKDDVKAAKLLLENEHNPDVTSKSGFTPLHIASHYGNQSIGNLLVQKGADVNYSAKHNITPLHVAAKWGKTNMVTLLLEQGANIESKTRDGLTPLHCAARSGHEQVVDMLLEKGAPISSKTKNGLAPLHMAAQGDHVDAARILLYHRAPVDEVTVDYLTALHVAAHCGHVRVAKLLLDRQADANARALNGFTPLHIACKKNRIKVVELLLKHGASIGATTESGLTPLHVASFMGCMNIVIYLLQHEANPDIPTVRGETPLHLAARANQTDIIRILLRNGAQVDARAREQQTPLHIASRLGNVDIVMLLLQHGAQVDTATKDMYTALHIAAKEGQDEVAAVLIDHGASLNATTKKGFTPLHLAAKYGHLKVAKLLLQKEAPVDAQGKNGVTPLHVASHYDHQNVALLLLEKGASPYASAKNGHTPLHIAARKNQMDIANTLLEYGAKPNAESKAGFTPLHLSAQEGHCDMTDLLIEHKADTNYEARNGLTALHLCAQEDKVPVAEILVKNGAQVDAATKNGYTPLHIACHYGQANMVRFLLSKGANVRNTTSLGYSPLHQAAQQGHANIVNILLETGAEPDAITNSGQTPLQIAQKLGYITVIDTLKIVTQPSSPSSSASEEKYKVVAPEAMHETFMSDSEEEGGEDTILGDHTYRYLTADEMKSLGDDSLPIDVTRDERIDSNRFVGNTEMLPPQHIEDSFSPEHVHQNYVEYIKKYIPDNVDIDKHPINIGFLVSFLVDARGGAMRGCRHSGVRVIVPPRCASSPTRITCRYVRPQRTPHPPPLMEGEALASRVLELGPVGAKFLGPVIIEVPHFAALRGKEREIVVLRSDNGETWKEHAVDATEEVLNEVLHDSFEAEDLSQLEDMSSGRITRIVTQDFPQYFAVVSRIRQEVHAIGPEGGMVSSTVVPQVQAVFPQGALTKKIKVGLQAQPIDPELTAKLLGHGVAVSPVVTVEPRRRKFHKAITLSMPAPRAHCQGMINQYVGSTPTLRLLCSITGGTTRAQWEDVTGSTPLTFVNDCVSFTTTVSARFWLMDCRNISDATKMATELYREVIHVPFMAKFVVFAKRVDPLEARLRVFCMTDDKEDKTLEHQEHFTEVAKSRDVEVLEGKLQYLEFAGNLVPITKSDEQLQFSFRAFRENRLPFPVRVKDQHAEAVSRCLFMREAKQPKGEPPQQPICILNIVLPDDIVADTISLTDSDSLKRQMFANENFDYCRPDPRLADMSNLLGEDWVPLAAHLGLTTSEINVIKSEYPDSVAKQAQSMLRMWLSQSGNKAQTNILESALKKIGREDIIPQCLNVDYAGHAFTKEIGKQRLIKETISIEQRIFDNEKAIKKDYDKEKDVIKDNYDKYSAEEKAVETSDEEDFNKTVSERRHQIEERLSVDRTVPASSQRVEIVQEISSIKRQSLVENKIAEVKQKVSVEATDTAQKTTPSPSAESADLLTADMDAKQAEAIRRDSDFAEEVTQRFEKKVITKISSTEDPKSPKFSKTPPPSPADFANKENEATIQEWDTTKKSSPKEGTPSSVAERDAEKQGFSTTTEHFISSTDKSLLDKPLDPSVNGLSVADDRLVIDLSTVLNQTNAFIKSESQPEPYDELAEKYCKKESINDKKVDDNKNNLNEKKKAKKGFFGSIKTFVEKSFESDSESEKSPKKSKKPKKEKKKTKDVKAAPDAGLPPRKPKLPTPPLELPGLENIPFVEASPSDLPPSYQPPELFEQEVTITAPSKPEETPVQIKEIQKKPQDAKGKMSPKKKTKSKTVVIQEVTKTIEPLVLEAEEFSVIIDPTKRESPKKSKEIFTVNIDESIDKREKEILEKSPIISEETIVKPLVELDFEGSELPVRPMRRKEHVYEDIEEKPAVLASPEDIKSKTTSLIENEINFGAWETDVYLISDQKLQEKGPEGQEIKSEIVEKHDNELSKELKLESKKKDEKKSGFFGLFKKKDSKKDDEQIVEEQPSLSASVIKNMGDTKNFINAEVEFYQDVRPEVSQAEINKISEDVSEDQKLVIVELTESTLKDMEDSSRFLKDEIDKYQDVQPLKERVFEETVEVKIQDGSQASVGFLGLFKKSKKQDEKFDETSLPKITDVLLKEDEQYVTEIEKSAPSAQKDKIKDLEREASPKPSSGFFGLFKKSKKEEDENAKSVLSDIVVKEIQECNRFLTDEVDNYHDVRPDKFDEIQEELVEIRQLESVKETLEPSESVKETPKPSSGLFGLFKKSKTKDEEELQIQGPSEEVVKSMEDSKMFLSDEVENYHDVKPDKFEIVQEEMSRDKHDVLEKAQAVKESSPKHSLFGFLKKSKNKEEEISKPVISEAALTEMSDCKKFLTDEIEHYHDAKPEKFEPLQREVVVERRQRTEESPSKRRIFGLFRKSKTRDEEELPTIPISAESLKEMESCKAFITNETDNYDDVKPEKFEPVEEVVAKIRQEVPQKEPASKESSPKSGLFGIFKRSKTKDGEESTVPSLSETALREMETCQQFLLEEVDKNDDVKPEKFESVQEEVTKVTDKTLPVREASPKSGLLGIFKKSKIKDDEEPLSESTIEEVETCGQFLLAEVNKYDDVKPEKFESVEDDLVKIKSDVVGAVKEGSPKPGFFGLFKRSRTKDEEVSTSVISEAALGEMESCKKFLLDEVENHRDVKPDKFEPVEVEKVTKITQEPCEKVPAVKESSPKPGFFDLFKKSKKDDDSPKPALSEAALKEMNETKGFVDNEVSNYSDVKPDTFEPIDKAIAGAPEVRETSQKLSSGLFGLFAKSKKGESEASKPVLSEEALKELDECKSFLTEEVSKYHDVKPEKFDEVEENLLQEQAPEVIEQAQEVKDSPSHGFFGLFKKSKKSEETSKPIISEDAAKEIGTCERFLADEVEKHDDVKPETFSAVQEDVVKIEEARESSPKPAHGFFGLFKKSKKDEDSGQPLKDDVQELDGVKPDILSEDVLRDMEHTDKFLKEEVVNYHDSIDKSLLEVKREGDLTETSPKLGRGIFGIFKRSKDSQDEVLVTQTSRIDELGEHPDVPPLMQQSREIAIHQEPLTETKKEIEKSPRKVKIREGSPKHRGILGIFKKSRDEDSKVAEEELGVGPSLSEEVIETINVSRQFLIDEVGNYQDVRPLIEESPEVAIQEQLTETKKDSEKFPKKDKVREVSPKPRGILGILKKSKDEDLIDSKVAEDDGVGHRPFLSEEVIETMNVSRQFLIDEVGNYQDVKPLIQESQEVTVLELFAEKDREKSPKKDKIREASPKPRGILGIFKKSKDEDLVETKVEEELPIAEAEQRKEIASRPSSGIFGIFRKASKDESKHISEEAAKNITETDKFILDEVLNYDDDRLVESEPVKTGEKLNEETQQLENVEEKVGFLAKFKRTKKKHSLQDHHLSEEMLKNMEETKKFISLELESYEDSQPQLSEKKPSKEDKVVTFKDVVEEKEKVVVVEAELPQPELLSEIKEIKKRFTDVISDSKEDVEETLTVVVQEEKDKKVEQEEVKTSPTKKNKRGKDKKGIFNIFSKKSKSQDSSAEHSKVLSEDDIESSPKKHKKRKGSSPFKIFEKTKKSEENVEEAEDEILHKVSQASQESENVEKVEKNLSEEVLEILDKEIEELRNSSHVALKHMSDCRDFLFIEKDNYDDGMPVIVTDIDKTTDEFLRTNAEKQVDQIISAAEEFVSETESHTIAEGVNVLPGSVPKLNDFICSRIDEVETESSEVTEAVKHEIEKSEQEITAGDVKLASKDVSEYLLESIEDSKVRIDEVSHTVADSVHELKDAAAKIVADETKNVATEVWDVTDKAKEKSDEAPETSKGFFSKLGSFITGKADEAEEGLKNVVETSERKIKEPAEESKAYVKTFTEDASKKIQSVQTGTREEFSKFKETKDVYEQEISIPASDLSTKIKDAATDFISDFNDDSNARIHDLHEDAAEGISHINGYKDAAEQKSKAQVANVTAHLDKAIVDTAKSVDQMKDDSQAKVVDTQAAIERGTENVALNIKTVGADVKEVTADVKGNIDTKIHDTQVGTAESVSNLKDQAFDIMRKTQETIVGVDQDIDNLKYETKTKKEATQSDLSDEWLTSTQQLAAQAAEIFDKYEKERAREVVDVSGSWIEEQKDSFDGKIKDSKDTAQDIKDTGDKKIRDVQDGVKSYVEVASEAVLGTTEDIALSSKRDLENLEQSFISTRKEIDEAVHLLEQSTKAVEPSSSIQSTTEILDDKGRQIISSAKTTAGALVSGLEDVTKTIEAQMKDADPLSTTKERLEEVHSEADRIRESEKQVEEILKGMRDDIQVEKDKARRDCSGTVLNVEKDLDDLNESLKSGAKGVEHAKSYITSPSMARRAVSQRYAKDERPTVREITSIQRDEESDEELYTVTEPEDEVLPKRKPLFHLLSEDDDSSESATKRRERRDSTKSNVLEALSENKIEDLLSNLETKLIKDLKESVAGTPEKVESKVKETERELETIKKESQVDVDQIEQKLRDLDEALDVLEQASDPKLEKKLHRVERKFERLASEVLDPSGESPTEGEARRDTEFQKLVSQLSTEEVSDFQKEYGHLWDETTFSKSEDWDSKTPDSQVDVQELPQGEELGATSSATPHEASLRAAEGSTSGPQQTTSQERPVADQHQLSDEMKKLLQELERESKQ